MDFIEAIEKRLGKKIEKNMMPIQAWRCTWTMQMLPIWLRI